MSWKSKLIGVLPKSVIAPMIARRSWTHRTASADDDHLNGYWNSDSPRRRTLISIIVDHLRPFGDRPTVLEFGSHVGVNLRLLAESTDSDPEMYAVEPNFEAVEFMKDKLPQVRTLRADHSGYLATPDFAPNPVTLSFANAVFYCMGPRETRRVLRRMFETSAVVVVGDNLANVGGAKTEFVGDHSSWAHPFETWLREFGADEISMTHIDDGDYALSGFLVARRSTPAASSRA